MEVHDSFKSPEGLQNTTKTGSRMTEDIDDAKADKEVTNVSTNAVGATMPPPSMGPPTRGPMGPPQTTTHSPIKSAQPKVTLDQNLMQQKIAEKKAKYMEVVGSLKYNPPATAASEPDTRYSFEVLKGGAIVDSIKFSSLERKGFYIVGRVPACDIVAENPTISRMHAIFQFIKGKEQIAEDDGQEVPTNRGLYIYDLDSSHGTFINKNQIYPKRYYRLKVGHVLKFGNSARLYILNGPTDDEEEESEKTVTELQNEKLQKELEIKRLDSLSAGAGAKDEVKEDDDGCGWGMADDAEEESDLRENPFAMNFEESESFDNPKKTLRSWFDREGFDLVYDCREKAAGQFICKINLPIDGPGGQAVFAEVDHKGKKKEAVVQAALQACQILDKYGVLRQSNQESRSQLKKKNWEEQDYYSSDEDTFLDRTGSVEKKREKRMQIAGRLEQKVETYESLCKQADDIQNEITSLQTQLQKGQKLNSMKAEDDVDLDDYMDNLKSGTTDLKQLKAKIRELSEELKRISKLRDIAKPANLPTKLNATFKTEVKDEVEANSKKVNHAENTNVSPSVSPKTEPTEQTSKHTKESHTDAESLKDTKKSTPDTESSKDMKESLPDSVSSAPKKDEKHKFKLFGPRMGPTKVPPTVLSKSVQEATTILVEDEEDQQKEPADPNSSKTKNPKDLSDPTSPMINADNESSSENEEEVDDGDSSDLQATSRKRKKKARNRQPRPKVKKDNTNFGAYDKSDPKYAVWVPPADQQGDGRTSLNDKLGY